MGADEWAHAPQTPAAAVRRPACRTAGPRHHPWPAAAHPRGTAGRRHHPARRRGQSRPHRLQRRAGDHQLRPAGTRGAGSGAGATDRAWPDRRLPRWRCRLPEGDGRLPLHSGRSAHQADHAARRRDHPDRPRAPRDDPAEQQHRRYPQRHRHQEVRPDHRLRLLHHPDLRPHRGHLRSGQLDRPRPAPGRRGADRARYRQGAVRPGAGAAQRRVLGGRLRGRRVQPVRPRWSPPRRRR